MEKAVKRKFAKEMQKTGKFIVSLCELFGRQFARFYNLTRSVDERKPS